jgi:hypothetical protein
MLSGGWCGHVVSFFHIRHLCIIACVMSAAVCNSHLIVDVALPTQIMNDERMNLPTIMMPQCPPENSKLLFSFVLYKQI